MPITNLGIGSVDLSPLIRPTKTIKSAARDNRAEKKKGGELLYVLLVIEPE